MGCRVLLLGCGARRKPLIRPQGRALSFDGDEVVTLDLNTDHMPDYVLDLEEHPNLPFKDDSFDEIHAYEVLEHIGHQGDYRLFFEQFSEYWRILKPDGLFCATTPAWDNVWAWGDPSHKRIINEGTLVFLSQRQYQNQVGRTAMSDFRHLYKADFETVAVEKGPVQLAWMLRAIKPPIES